MERAVWLLPYSTEVREQVPLHYSSEFLYITVLSSAKELWYLYITVLTAGEVLWYLYITVVSSGKEHCYLYITVAFWAKAAVHLHYSTKERNLLVEKYIFWTLTGKNFFLFFHLINDEINGPLDKVELRDITLNETAYIYRKTEKKIK